MLQVLLVMQPLRYSRVRVLVTSSAPSPPSPHVCQEVDIYYMYLHSKNLNLYLSVQVVQVVEASVHSVIVTLYPGLSSVAGVRCPCLASKVSSPLCCTDPLQPRVQACSSHKIKRCQDPNCLHLLPLHQCFGSTSVWCGYFKVDTSSIRRHFPLETGDWCQLDSLAPRHHQPPSPPWLRGGLIQNISTFTSRIL